jgi:hypothetical protein
VAYRATGRVGVGSIGRRPPFKRANHIAILPTTTASCKQSRAVEFFGEGMRRGGGCMAGLPSATLQGWAIPLIAAPYGEHTYVTSSCGLKWGCWGRDFGGAALSAAIGSSVVADCLSQPNSEAGIRYARTGVCHQTANRILHPAGITVAGCQGYVLSAFTFGPHGIGNWPQLSTCYPPGTILAPVVTTAAPQSPAGNLLARISVYNSTVSSTVATQEASHVAELAALVEMALGHRIEKTTLKSLATIQADLRRTQSQLARWLDTGRVTPDQYLDMLNTTLRAAMEQSRILLGDERFQVIFGEPGKHPEGLVNRATFMEQIASEAKPTAR